jgi:hypothetical protein
MYICLGYYKIWPLSWGDDQHKICHDSMAVGTQNIKLATAVCRGHTEQRRGTSGLPMPESKKKPAVEGQRGRSRSECRPTDSLVMLGTFSPALNTVSPV